jgi:hypothetical protein
MATKPKTKPWWQATLNPNQPVKRIRKVEPVTDELYHWIKNGVQNKSS